MPTLVLLKMRIYVDKCLWYVTVKVSLEEFIEISKNSYFWEEG